MRVTSPSFGHNERIPRKHTCDGEDVSPALELADVPAGAQSLAVINDDPDAPVGTWVHWVEYDIAPTTLIPEAAKAVGTEGRNSWGSLGFRGSCPPSGTHRYVFKLYALDTTLELAPGASKEQVLAAMEGHVLAQAELVGLYSR